MARLKWSSDLDTGITEIDNQHKRIVDYINRLYKSQTMGNRKGVGEVIEEMVDYTASHFTFEEGMLESAGYEFSKAHRRVHELFVRRVVEYKNRFNAGEDVIDELLTLLSRWLFSHIRSEDHAYVASVHAYLRTRRGYKDKMGDDLLRELEERSQKKGMLARLFGR